MAPVHAVAEHPPQPAHAGLSRRMRDLRTPRDAAGAAGAFVTGVPALDHFPLTLWRRMLERAWRALSAEQLNYADAAGEAALREAIADHLRASRGVVCDAGQVFITDGTQSSLDLCCRAVDDDGIAPGTDDWLLRPPRLIYTTPSHQYPTGSVLSLPRRLALIEAARAAGALVIEDDYDSEFRHDGAPLSAMQGLAPDAPVLYLGTFSKTMFPSLRLAFMVVPKALAASLAALRAQSSSRGRVAEQLALAEFLRGGQFALHLRRMRRLYRQRRDALADALHEHLGGVATVHGASAGMHLALRFHDAALDDADISAQAREHGIVAHALSAQGTQGTCGWNGLMLGYAQVPAERMEELVRALAALPGLRAAIAGPASKI